jgi:peptide/nickel transport system substrate-binding protein
MRSTVYSLRAISIVASLALALVACSDQAADTTTTSTTEPTTTTTTLPPDPAVDGPVLRVGLTSGLSSVNWWEVLGSASTPENLALVSPTKASLFTLTRPGFVLVPDLAAANPARARDMGGGWVVEQPIRDDLFWSDGVQVTAHDLAFYFNVVREFDLGAGHAVNFPASVVDVSAPDDFVVRIEFANLPSIVDWQAGVGLAPFAPAHFWETHVEEARSRGSGIAHLYAVDPAGEPSAGPLEFESWEPGEMAVTVSNPTHHGRGTETTLYSDGSARVAWPDGEDAVYGGSASGSVEAHHVVGPFVSGVHWMEYGSAETAYEALEEGRVDFVFDPEGMSLAMRNRLVAAGDLRISTSEAEGFRFLGFNLRKPPMSDRVFREAVATVIDKELVAATHLGGALSPAYTVVHPGLTPFYEPTVRQPGWSGGEPMGERERFETAVSLLTEAGYTWQIEPELVFDDDGTLVDVVAGSGLRMPNGVVVPELTILVAPASGDDPMRATFALWIAHWMAHLGIDVVVDTTDLGSMMTTAVAPESATDALAWDLKVSGWGRAQPALPGLTLVALFHSRGGVEVGGLNTTGYRSPEFDAAADSFSLATTIDEAARWTREMERIVAEDLPYVVLYRTSVTEAFSPAVRFPVETVMGGHAATGRAWPESVRLVRR